jgi:hypothetical protein
MEAEKMMEQHQGYWIMEARSVDADSGRFLMRRGRWQNLSAVRLDDDSVHSSDQEGLAKAATSPTNQSNLDAIGPC